MVHKTNAQNPHHGQTADSRTDGKMETKTASWFSKHIISVTSENEDAVLHNGTTFKAEAAH